MKKIIKVVGLILLAVLSIYIYNLIKPEYVEGGDQVFFEKNSYDNRYKMIVSTEKNLNMDFIKVVIIDNTSKKEVYIIEGDYRAFDFKWITWEEESNSFWINSSDLGIFCYAYIDNSTWNKYSLRKKSGVYYLYKGNQLIENENEVFNRKLPNGYNL